MTFDNRHPEFWIISSLLALFLLLLLVGQTLAMVDYGLAVSMGLQESVAQVGEYGVQVNRAFSASDTLVYIPLIISSLVGLTLRKPWALQTLAAVMGISLYWTSTIGMMFYFLPDTPGYNFEPGVEYAIFMGAFFLFGLVGLFYLARRGKYLID